MPPGPGLSVETLRALARPSRFIPILLVCIPLIIGQDRFSRAPGAVPVAILFCLGFVLIAPLSWRILFPEDLAAFGRTQVAARLLLYAILGAGTVLTLGVAIPKLAGIGVTFLTQRYSLLISGGLFLVGGWGLGRDVGFEASLTRERARSSRLAYEAEQSQLLALRAHLDPHFLFNTLNAIAEWCRQDGETAEKAVLQLSDLLRGLLRGVRASSWPLSEELALVRALFDLHRLRDPEAFELRWEVDPAVEATPVPPLLLLPLAENAVKHGPAAGHPGVLSLSCRRVGDKLEVSLENAGAYRGPRVGSSGVPTVERRTALAYGGAATLALSAVGDRTRATLALPLAGPQVGV